MQLSLLTQLLLESEPSIVIQLVVVLRIERLPKPEGIDHCYRTEIEEGIRADIIIIIIISAIFYLTKTK